MTVLNDLTAARTIIAERGLAKGAFNRHADGSVCTIGAVVAAIGRDYSYVENTTDPWEDPRAIPVLDELYFTLLAVEPLAPEFGESPASRRQRIYRFNDTDETTQADVLGLFDTTIARIAPKESK